MISSFPKSRKIQSFFVDYKDYAETYAGRTPALLQMIKISFLVAVPIHTP